MKVIITIPAYNEEKAIGSVIDEINQVMKNTPYKYSILVLNDGSTDSTEKIARSRKAIVVSNKRRSGLAEVFRTEMEQCLRLKADIIVHTDADGQYPAEFIPEMIKRVEEGSDLVLGSRFGRGKYSEAATKKIGNIIFAKVLSSLLKTRITDSTTGFRAFTREVAELPIINSFTYTQEQLIRASKNKMKITEVPITTRKTRKSRLFKNPLDYALKAWINIFRIYRDYAPLKFFGTSGAILFALGCAIGLYFIWLHLTTGIKGHLGLLFLMLMLVFTGIQIMFFGFLADMNKK